MSDSVMRERWRVLKAMEPDVPNSRLKKLDLGPTLDKADLAAKKWHKLVFNILSVIPARLDQHSSITLFWLRRSTVDLQ